MNPKMKYPLVGLRGRAYECAGCNNYQGERSMVQSHYYNNHVKPEDIPFRCKLCNFKCTTEKALQQHFNWYKDHKTLVQRRKEDGLSYEDGNIMIKSETPKFLTVDKELVRLDTKKSEEIWQSRKRTTKTQAEQTTSKIQPTITTTTDPLTLTPTALQPLDTSISIPFIPTLPDLDLSSFPLQTAKTYNYEDNIDNTDTINLIDDILGSIPAETTEFYEKEQPPTSTVTTPVYLPTNLPISITDPLNLEQPTHEDTTPHITEIQFQQLLDQNNRTNQLLESTVKQLEDNNKYVYWLGQTVRRAQQTTKQHIYTTRLITAQETTLRHIMETTQPRNTQRTQQRTQPRAVQRRRNTTQRQRPQNRPRSRSPRR